MGLEKMDDSMYIESLVAQFLHSKGYYKTLSALEEETQTKFTPTTLNNDESLQSIVEDRINFKTLQSHTENAHHLENGDVNTLDSLSQSDIVRRRNIILPNWEVKYPDSVEVLNLGTLNSLIIDSSYFSSFIGGKIYNLGLFVTNTKYLLVYDIDANQLLLSVHDPLNGQPIKLVYGIPYSNHLFLCDMNGNLRTMSLKRDGLQYDMELVTNSNDSVKLHRRLITDFTFKSVKLESDSTLLGYFSSIGWDGRVTLGLVREANNELIIKQIGEYKLFTNPTCILLTIDKETNLPLLLVGRLESSLLTIFSINKHPLGAEEVKLVELGKLSLNDSEFSSHSFQTMSIGEISYNNKDLIITVATDHIPYMRLITVLVPSIEEILSYSKNIDPNYSVFEKLDKLVVKDNNQQFTSSSPILRSYIISNFNSLSPQDKYSNAIILSRPNCSGLWIPGDDGKLRGFDLRTGNVIETLDSNDGRAKSAFIGQCGMESEVVVVCGAVDKKIVIWRCS